MKLKNAPLHLGRPTLKWLAVALAKEAKHAGVKAEYLHSVAWATEDHDTSLIQRYEAAAAEAARARFARSLARSLTKLAKRPKGKSASQGRKR